MKRGAALETARADMASMNPDRARRLLRDDRYGPPTANMSQLLCACRRHLNMRLDKALLFPRSLYNPLTWPRRAGLVREPRRKTGRHRVSSTHRACPPSRRPGASALVVAQHRRTCRLAPAWPVGGRRGVMGFTCPSVGRPHRGLTQQLVRNPESAKVSMPFSLRKIVVSTTRSPAWGIIDSWKSAFQVPSVNRRSATQPART